MADLSKISTDELVRMFASGGAGGQPPTRELQLDPAAVRAGKVTAATETIAELPRYAYRAGMGALQGAGDLPFGVGQLATRFAPEPVRTAYDDFMRRKESAFKQEGASQIGRVSGNILGAAGIAPSAPAATLGGRVLQGGTIGGAMGLASPISPDAQNYWASKAITTGVGVGVGAAAPVAIEGIGAAISGTINKLAQVGRAGIARVAGQGSPGNIETTLTVELQRQGVDWSRVPRDIRSATVAEIQRALEGGAPVSPQTAARLAQFRIAGIQPTTGQVTRDPAQWAMEQNLAKTEIGSPLAQRFGEQQQRLVSGVESTRPPSTGADPYAAGQSVISGLQAKDRPVRQGVTAAYETARAKAGIEADVPLQPVAQTLGQLVEDFGSERIPAAVSSRLREFGIEGGKQTRVFNIREAEKLKTLIGNNIENPNSPSGKALTLLKRSVDDAINSLSGGGAGAQAAGAFQTARTLAASRFANLERTPALQNALQRGEVTAPEKFIEKFAIRGEVKDVANLMRNLPVDARPEVRAGVIDWIRGRAIAGSGDTAKFTQAGLRNALQTIGDRKLELIFAGDQRTLSQLRNLSRVGALTQVPPTSAGVNWSSSGTTILDSLERASRLPILSAVLGRPGDIAKASAVTRTLDQPLANIPPGNLPIPPEQRARMLQLLGVGAAPVGGILGSQMYR